MEISEKDEQRVREILDLPPKTDPVARAAWAQAHPDWRAYLVAYELVLKEAARRDRFERAGLTHLLDKERAEEVRRELIRRLASSTSPPAE